MTTPTLPVVTASGGDVTVMRTLAAGTWGTYTVELPDGLEPPAGPEGARQDGYVSALPVAHRRRIGGFGRRFIRADLNVSAKHGTSDVEQNLDLAAERTEADVFVEFDLTKANLGHLIPEVHFTVGDYLNVLVWGRIITLPVTKIDPIITEGEITDWLVHVGGQIVSDDDQRRADNDASEAKIRQERLERAGATARAQATANEAKADASDAQADAGEALRAATDADGVIQGKLDEARLASEAAAGHSADSLAHSETSLGHSEASRLHSQNALLASQRSTAFSGQSAAQSALSLAHSETSRQHSVQSGVYSADSLAHSETARGHSVTAGGHATTAQGHATEAAGHSADSLLASQEASGHSSTAAGHSADAQAASVTAGQHSTTAGEHSTAAAGHAGVAEQHSAASAGHSTDAKVASTTAGQHSTTAGEHSTTAAGHSSDANTFSLASAGSAEDADVARGLAEEARRLAENARAAAEAERSAAETARSAAETARSTAESERSLAETARSAAEGARTGAESERMLAETARAAAEKGRSDAEAARSAAEAARDDAEAKRAAAEAARARAMAAMAASSAAMAAAEASRSMAETARAQAETLRNAAEQERMKAETARSGAESARSLAETARSAAETARSDAERERSDAEAARTAAETARSLAEEQRRLADTARGEAVEAAVDASDAALTAVMVASPQESVLPANGAGRPYWSYGFPPRSFTSPNGDVVYIGPFESGDTAEAFFRLTDVVDFKLVWWMRADAPATVSFRLVDTAGVNRIQAVRMWSPDTGEWVNTTSVSVPTPDAWTEYSAVVRVTPGTEDVRLVAGGAVLLSDVRLGVFSLMQEQINAEAQARDQELDVRLQEVDDLVKMVQDLQAQMQGETNNTVVFPRQTTTLITRADWESPSGSIDVRATGTWTGRAIVTSVVQRNMDQVKVEIPIPSSTGSRYIPNSAFLSGYNWMEVQYWKHPLIQTKHGPTSNTVDFAVEKSTWTQVTRQTVTLGKPVTDLMVWFTVIWDAANNYSQYGHRVRHSNGTIVAQWGPSSGVGPLTPLGSGVQSRTVSGTAKSLPAGSLYFEVYSTSDYPSSRATRVTTVQATWLQEP